MIAFFKDEQKRTLLFLGLSFVSLIISFFNIGNLPVDAAWVAILLCGLPIVKGAVVGLVTEFDIKADVLVSIALVASVIISQIFAAGEIAFIMSLGAYLEERTVSKARAGIQRLIQLTPATARVQRQNEFTVIPAEEVQKGEILRVLAGETIAVDGIVVQGNTSINQAVMTGESLPVDKTTGDEVFSGTVNQYGTFDMLATKVGKDSSLQRMIQLVQSADADKAKIVGIADRWATWIVVIALASAIITWIATGEIIRAVTILVVFCPCALVLATPTAIMAGIGNASKYGILVREGDALERLAGVKCIAFDKTGTLTCGKPVVTEIYTGDDTALTKQELLQLAASAEINSEHPLGKAIVEHYKTERGTLPPQPQSFSLLAGMGITATIEQKEILAGNLLLLEQNNIRVPQSLLHQSKEASDNGCTIIFVAVNGLAAGYIALADVLRPDVAATIAAVQKTGVETLLLTGDSAPAANHIAQSAGIAKVRAACLPQDKMDAIAEYQQNGQPVCMVGDGINDAPALKTVHVGIAMGGIGSDIAVDAADIALVGDDIKQLPHLLLLAKKTMRTIHINLAASLLLNFVAIILAISGLIDPVLGALVHNAGSVTVIILSALLLNWREHK
ncbi:MAG: heavy metal translocating P-type ATPase [Oscillospiraceae bacterium]